MPDTAAAEPLPTTEPLGALAPDAAAQDAALSRPVRRSIRLSYAQSMLGAIFNASTGGMFLIGYALQLGATDAQLGWLSTIPMFCVVMQLGACVLVERGISRRWLTVVGFTLNALGWFAVILIPFVTSSESSHSSHLRLVLLIGIISLNTLFAHLAGNARGSWIGDLVPAPMRGRFFGRISLFGGIVAMAFALIEGFSLDHIKGLGLKAFGLLFGFGMIFGLINAALFIPQADVPLTPRNTPDPRNLPDPRFTQQRPKQSGSLRQMIRATFRNRELMCVLLFNLLWGLQSISAPFYADYMITSLHMPYFGMGIITAAFMLAMLASSPFWGRIVDRYGCRPVLICCAAVFIPGTLSWLPMTSATRVYCTIIPVHLIVGTAAGGINVALNTLIFKVTPTVGRSVQLAIYAVIVGLLAAPMPAIGGHLPQWLGGICRHTLGFTPDLRIIFFTQMFFVVAAVIAARSIPEPGSRRTRELVRDLPNQVLETLNPMV